ncbi:MAG: hypothetical protein ABW252_00545 [Polyangiales bacterium]
MTTRSRLPFLTLAILLGACAADAARDDAPFDPRAQEAQSGATPASTGILLPADPGAVGPYGSQTVATAPGLSSHMLYVPRKLGEGGVKHPIIVWTNGATGTANFYDQLLTHFASHGFFMVVDKRSGANHNAEIPEQKAGIAWAVAEATRAGSPYAGKIDPERIGVAGHSLGSVASFATAADPRVKASIHWSGGLTGNPVGAEESWLQGLHAPAAFFCGGAEARALPRCSGDFREAPEGIPVFYGTVANVTHTGMFGEPRAGEWGRGGVAFMRWALAGETQLKDWFSGPSCTLCKRPWTGQARNI